VNIYNFLWAIPEHGYFPVKIKADHFALLQSQMVMQCLTHGRTEFAKAVNEEDGTRRVFRQFGSYQLL